MHLLLGWPLLLIAYPRQLSIPLQSTSDIKILQGHQLGSHQQPKRVEHEAVKKFVNHGSKSIIQGMVGITNREWRGRTWGYLWKILVQCKWLRKSGPNNLKVRPHYATRQNATRHGLAVWQKLLSICHKIDRVHIKKQFFPTIFQFTKTVERETWTNHMPHQKLPLHYSWWQILVWLIFDDTDTLPIEFSCRTAFCNMPHHAEAVPKPHCVDIYTIFGVYHVAMPRYVAFCHVA